MQGDKLEALEKAISYIERYGLMPAADRKAARAELAALTPPDHIADAGKMVRPAMQDKMEARAKPLFWRKATDHPQDSGQWVADGIAGRYSAEKQKDGSWLLWWAHDNFIWEKCADFAEVKRKAEADWQARFADRIHPAHGPCMEDGGFVGPAITTAIQDASTPTALAPPPVSDGGEMEPISKDPATQSQVAAVLLQREAQRANVDGGEFVMVPREATEAMLDQGVAALESAPFVPPSKVWEAMLRVAPSRPYPSPEQREVVAAHLRELARKAFFVGRGSKPPKAYDSEAVEAVWERDVQAILSALCDRGE